MNKTRNNELIKLANDKLRESNIPTGNNKENIAESYDGKTAALSVSVAMSDLLPTLAIYYQDFDSKHPNNPCRRNVLNVVATMITKPGSEEKFSNAKDLLRYALSLDKRKEEDMTKLKNLKKEVIDCSIALKQVVRTYNLVKNEESA